ncbi:MAG: hypothetical protein MN733_32115 [Nitrososphaera sp.]|nr:hypothetical protein [Nitrososphaera sp.]
MEAILYPYHTLIPYQIDDDIPAPELAAIAATLLYFDRVTLGRLGYADELSLPGVAELLEQAKRIEETRGKDKVDAWRQGKYIGKYNVAANEGLSCSDIFTLAHLAYTYDDLKFRKSYWPLLNEDILRIASLATITRGARSSAEAAGSDQAKYLDIRSLLVGYMSYKDEFAGWPETDADVKVFGEAYRDADGSGFTGAYLQQLIKKSVPDELDKMEFDTLSALQREAFLMDLFSQTALSHMLHLPIVSLAEAHLTLRARYAARMPKRQAVDATPQSTEALATQLFTQTLIKLPTVIPKSCEALLETRMRLADELQSFRDAVNDAAEDLVDAADGSVVSIKKVAQTVKQKFVRPLRDLERKLQHPSRDLGRNLVSNPSFVTSGVTLATAVLAGLGGVVEMTTALLTGVSGAVAVPVLTQAVKTKFDRQREIEKSSVAFLVRAKSP